MGFVEKYVLRQIEKLWLDILLEYENVPGEIIKLYYFVPKI